MFGGHIAILIKWGIQMYQAGWEWQQKRNGAVNQEGEQSNSIHP
jgi:hypothetical protein